MRPEHKKKQKIKQTIQLKCNSESIAHTPTAPRAVVCSPVKGAANQQSAPSALRARMRLSSALILTFAAASRMPPSTFTDDSRRCATGLLGSVTRAYNPCRNI